MSNENVWKGHGNVENTLIFQKYCISFCTIRITYELYLTFTLLSFLGVLAMLLKIGAGKGLKLFLYFNSFFLDINCQKNLFNPLSTAGWTRTGNFPEKAQQRKG